MMVATIMHLLLLSIVLAIMTLQSFFRVENFLAESENLSVDELHISEAVPPTQKKLKLCSNNNPSIVHLLK